MRWSIAPAAVRLLVLAVLLVGLSFCAVPSDGIVDDDGEEPPAEEPVFTPPDSGLVTAVPASTVTTITAPAGEYLPAADAAGVNVDTLLRLGFDSVPTIGAAGTIRIARVSDDVVVDSINVADVAVTAAAGFQLLTAATMNTKVNIIGNTPGSGAEYPNQVRAVNYYPVKVEGSTVKIVPHNNKLGYNTAYYVLIDDGTLAGTFGGSAFAGITVKTTWQFTTKAAPSVSGATISVDADGSGDFSTVQGALDYIPANNATVYTVQIANGIYEELLFTRNKSNIVLAGESQADTVIQYDNFDSYNNGTGSGTTANTATGLASDQVFARGGRSVFLIAGGTGFELNTLTMRSTHAQGSAAANQAETFYFNSTSGTLIARTCVFTGYQDTMQLKGFCWFYNCFISGDTDFIWGAVNTALFERCEIQSRFNVNGGYLVQARAVATYAGFVFLNCDLTREAAVGDQAVYLARSYTTSGANAAYNDNVAFIGCQVDSHIKAVGFLLPAVVLATNPASSTPVAGWREYKSFSPAGALLDVSGRGATNGTTAVAGNPYSTNPATLGCIQLSDADATAFYATRAAIFAESTTDGTNTMKGVTGGWNPQP
jgi:pectin methylesterase-like acyl-CoA thioesterase